MNWRVYTLRKVIDSFQEDRNYLSYELLYNSEKWGSAWWIKTLQIIPTLDGSQIKTYPDI